MGWMYEHRKLEKGYLNNRIDQLRKRGDRFNQFHTRLLKYRLSKRLEDPKCPTSQA